MVFMVSVVEAVGRELPVVFLTDPCLLVRRIP
jgi:hypothetical protein